MDTTRRSRNRLGISKSKPNWMTGLFIILSRTFIRILNQVNARKTERQEFVNGIVTEVREHLEKANLKADVTGRVKHFFSIYKKMVNQDKTIDQIL